MVWEREHLMLITSSVNWAWLTFGFQKQLPVPFFLSMHTHLPNMERGWGMHVREKFCSSLVLELQNPPVLDPLACTCRGHCLNPCPKLGHALGSAVSLIGSSRLGLSQLPVTSALCDSNGCATCAESALRSLWHEESRCGFSFWELTPGCGATSETTVLIRLTAGGKLLVHFGIWSLKSC